MLPLQIIRSGLQKYAPFCKHHSTIGASTKPPPPGFRLTKEGIFPCADKLKAVKETKPPENVKHIRQFLGLCNFFQGHIQNFAQITSPLTNLMKKDSAWEQSSLPEAA